MNSNQRNNDEEKFENELYASLRFYGYLFPENEKDVEVFETLYGNTEIEAPSFEKLFSENNMIIDSDPIDFNMRLAAFSPSATHLPDFFKDDTTPDIDPKTKDT